MSTIPPITSINQLVKNLMYGAGYDGYQAILDAINFDRDEVAHLCHWNKKNYVRINLAKIDVLELYMICWEMGQETPIYDLNFTDAWVYVLDGELTEENFKKPTKGNPPKKYGTKKLPKGAFTETIDSIDLHRLTNTNNGRTISLHLFMDKVKTWNVYDNRSGQMKELPFESDFTHSII